MLSRDADWSFQAGLVTLKRIEGVNNPRQSEDPRLDRRDEDEDNLKERVAEDLEKNSPDISGVEEKDVDLLHCDVARQGGSRDEVGIEDFEEKEEREKTVESQQNINGEVVLNTSFNVAGLIPWVEGKGRGRGAEVKYQGKDGAQEVDQNHVVGGPVVLKREATIQGGPQVEDPDQAPASEKNKEGESKEALEVAIVCLDSETVGTELLSIDEGECPKDKIFEREQEIDGGDVEKDGAGNESLRKFGAKQAVGEQ